MKGQDCPDRRFLDLWTAEKILGDRDAPLSRELLEAYTVEKLRQTLDWATVRSPFYKEQIGELLETWGGAGSMGHNAAAGKVAGAAAYESFWQAFRRLPFVTSRQLRERELDFLCVGPGEISRIVTLDTGGSTGSPKRIYFTPEDQQLTVDYFQNGMRLLVNAGDCVLILMPARAPGSIGKLLARGLENFGARAVDYGLPSGEGGEARRLLELIQRKRVTAVAALPTHMRLLAETALALPEKERPRLRCVLLSAEYVPEDLGTILKGAFGCRVYEHYGMTEMGLGCAVSCGEGAGYHIREADLYIEIVDPETGRVIQDERPGEIVFTTLNRRGMPFIRYRTGDRSHWINEGCGCGSLLKRLARVEPREETKGYLRNTEGRNG